MHDIVLKQRAAMIHLPMLMNPLRGHRRRRTFAMLAEKFIVLRETMRLQKARDEAPRVVSTSPHLPVQLKQSAEAAAANDLGAAIAVSTNREKAPAGPGLGGVMSSAI